MSGGEAARQGDSIGGRRKRVGRGRKPLPISSPRLSGTGTGTGTGTKRLSVADGIHVVEDLHGVREAVVGALRKDEAVVHVDLENAAREGDQLRLDPRGRELLPHGVEKPVSRAQVIPHLAVVDRELEGWLHR